MVLDSYRLLPSFSTLCPYDAKPYAHLSYSVFIDLTCRQSQRNYK